MQPPDPTQSRVFCVLPWMHLRANQDGKLLPCCRCDEDYAYGSLRERSLAAAWTGEKIQAMRAALLRGEPQAACSYCYKLEAAGASSWREQANARFSAHVDNIRASLAQGATPSATLAHLDLRFSNACNFRCRSCGPEKSSAWYADARKLVRDAHFPYTAVIRPTSTGDALSTEIEPFLDQVESIYFAGGEPLLDPEHERFLDRLLAAGRTHIRLEYNTNFSFPARRAREVLERWKRFEHIKVSASLDGVGKQGELLRKGMHWAEIEANFMLLRRELPQAEFEIFPTITAMNAFHVVDAIRCFLELGMLTRPEELLINVALGPRHLSINVLDERERTALRDRYAAFTTELMRTRSLAWAERVERELGQVLALFSPAVDREGRTLFRRYTIQLDHIRGERSAEIFPELFPLLYEANTELAATPC